MHSHPKLQHLPAYLQESIGSENSDFEFKNEIDKHFFEAFFETDQHVDQMLAYEFAEAELKGRHIQEMQETDFINLIKSINRIAANSLMKIKGSGQKAGEFSTQSIGINKESGIPGKKYHSTNIEYNFEIIKNLYGLENAQAYKEFFLVLQKEAPIVHRENPGYTEYQIFETVFKNHADSIGCQMMMKTSYFIDHQKIPAKIACFASALKKMIVDGEDPIFCATYALYHLVMGHYFPHGNRRTARIFISWLLASLGINPILIPRNKTAEYYLAIEKCSDENLQPLYNLMKEFSEAQHEKHSESISSKGERFWVIHQSAHFAIELHTDHYLLQILFDSELARIATEIVSYKNMLKTAEEKNTPIDTAKVEVSLKELHNKYSQKASLLSEPQKTIAKYAVERVDNDFYLRASESYALIHPQVSQYFYEQRKRFSRPKQIISIGPSETARVSVAHSSDIQILVSLRADRRAVLIKDDLGNISFTHLDRWNSLDFIQEEVKALNGKNITVDIFKKENDMDIQEHKRLLQSVSTQLGPEIKNSKGKKEVRTTKEGTLLVNQGRVYQPKENDLLSITPANRALANTANRASCRVKSENPLRNCEISEGSLPLQVRVANRLIRQFENAASNPPTLVFDNQWTGDYPQFGASSEMIATTAYSLKDNPREQRAFLIRKAQAIFGENLTSNELSFIDKMPQMLSVRNTILQNNLYSHLHNFFKKPTAEALPGNVLNIIAEYTQTEEDIARAYIMTS